MPVFRGHILTEEDLIIRQHILNLMCQFKTTWHYNEGNFKELHQVLESLQEMTNDGLLIIKPNSIVVTEKGKPFVRNICMAFDLRLKRRTPQNQLFSMTV